MKPLLATVFLGVTLACQAAEPTAAEPAAGAAPAAIKLPQGRCPTRPAPEMVATRMSGKFQYIARFLLKSDGSIENIRVEGRGPQGQGQNIRAAIASYRCLPADADQEIVSTFDFKVD